MKKFLEFLYWFQLVLAIVFASSQLNHMLVNSTKGLSTSMFTATAVFVFLNLFLAVKAHLAGPSRVTRQVVVIYILGAVTYTSFLAVMVAKAEGVWDTKDSLTMTLVGLATLGAIVWSRNHQLAALDPLMKGVYSMIFKSIPQLVMAAKIWQVGGAGLAPIMIVTFHVLTLCRLFQVEQSIREAGWDRNRLGLALSETGNEISWSLVTIAWIIS